LGIYSLTPIKFILVERNQNWMPVLESLFKNNKTEFVLVFKGVTLVTICS